MKKTNKLMQIFKRANLIILLSIFMVIGVAFVGGEKSLPVSLNSIDTVTVADPPSIQMYYYIEKYAKEYDIPINYAYGIAYKESRYGGPWQWSYNHKLTSKAGALGPMQIIPSTAAFINDEKVTKAMKFKLKNDIEYNVRTSMKLLRYLRDHYDTWKEAIGCYNTGSPIVNKYAMSVYIYKPEWNTEL